MEICTLASSSSGNCTLLSHDGVHILIDAGISLRRIKNCLAALGITPGELSGVLVTHGHIDHINGIKMLVKYHGTRIFATSGTLREIFYKSPEVQSAACEIAADDEFELSGIGIKSFPTPHDAPDSVGYTVSAGGRRLAYATDLGCVTDDILNASLGVDVAIIEANHDIDMLKKGDYPYYLKKRILSKHGHLSNEDSGMFASRLESSGTRRIVLAHLSRENNTPNLARDTVGRALSAGGATLTVAAPDIMGERYII